MEKGNFYDLEQIKAVRISDILRDYGIPVKRGFFKIRDERTSSCKLYEATNSFFDFGAQVGGSCINLIEQLDCCGKKEAIEKLASMYGIDPVGQQRQGPVKLTDTQYAVIGIIGDRASKNIDFDLLHRDIEKDYKKLEWISEKYAVSMNELKEKDLRSYEVFLKYIGIPTVNRLKDNYINELRGDFVFRSLLRIMDGAEIPPIRPENEIQERFKPMQEELNRAERVLETACRGCETVGFRAVKHDAVREYHDMAGSMDAELLYGLMEANPWWFENIPNRTGILPEPKDGNPAQLYKEAAEKILEGRTAGKSAAVAAPETGWER